MQPWRIAELLILLALANGAPVIAKKIFRNHLSAPLDGGALFFDGRPVFGPSKTVRGVVLALGATALGAALLGLGWQTGILVAGLAMAGDLLSSFIKRRLGRPASSRAIGLDQVPESLLPLLACRGLLLLSWADVLAVAVLFLVGELLLSRLLYKAHIRDQPY
jgi:CDP-2,3-bis-(O-geranylgeranyl)-sn-glycerol synthase